MEIAVWLLYIVPAGLLIWAVTGLAIAWMKRRSAELQRPLPDINKLLRPSKRKAK